MNMAVVATRGRVLPTYPYTLTQLIRRHVWARKKTATSSVVELTVARDKYVEHIAT
jgi:hypothetical protein